MKKLTLAALVAASIALLGCREDDVKTDDTADTDAPTGTTDSGVTTDDTGTTDDTATTGDGSDAIVGTWVSEGGDLSPLFAGNPFNYTRVLAVFESSGDLAVTATDSSGAATDFVATYTVDTSTYPGTIVVDQSAPYAAISEGIWQVDGDTLTYEVVQVDPDYGYTPPTPESGFGSTAGPNLTPDINIQIYQRQ